jgi:hypothetical protein
LVIREFDCVEDFFGEIAFFTLVAVHYKPVKCEEVHVFASVDSFGSCDADEFEKFLAVKFYSVGAGIRY